MGYLDNNGLSYLWGKIKAYVDSHSTEGGDAVSVSSVTYTQSVVVDSGLNGSVTFTLPDAVASGYICAIVERCWPVATWDGADAGIATIDFQGSSILVNVASKTPQQYQVRIRVIYKTIEHHDTSHVGMIIQSTTLDTMAKVIAVYGGTTWIRHSGYFLYGATSGVTANHAAADGGEATHTLTEAEMPSHGHSVFSMYEYSGGQWDGLIYQSMLNDYRFHGLGNANFIGNTGGNQPHNNMPPYKNVYIWERTA